MIKIISNVLDEQLIQDLQKYVATTENHRSSYKSWGSTIVKYSAPVLLFNLNEELYKRIEQVEIFDLKGKDFSVHYAGFPRLSYIPWHTDTHMKRAITIYLNKEWELDWGGYLCVNVNDEYKSIIPKYNMAVELSNIPHSVTTVNIDAPMRETIQIFVKD